MKRHIHIAEDFLIVNQGAPDIDRKLDEAVLLCERFVMRSFMFSERAALGATFRLGKQYITIFGVSA